MPRLAPGGGILVFDNGYHRGRSRVVELDRRSGAVRWTYDRDLDQVIITDFAVNLRGAAFYEDRYRKTDEGWKISHTGYQRTFEEMHPRSAIEGLNLTANGFS